MADIVEATTTSLDETVNGVKRTFKYLNSYDKANILREYRRVERDRVLKNRKDAGCSPEQIAVDLDEFDRNAPREWKDYLETEEGAVFALGLSLEKTYPNEGHSIARSSDLTPPQELQILLKVAGLQLKPIVPAEPATEEKPVDQRTYGDGGAEAEGAGEANPTPSPATYKTPEAA